MSFVLSRRARFSRRERILAGVVSVGVASSATPVEDGSAGSIVPVGWDTSLVAAAVAAAIVEDTAAGKAGRLKTG